MVGHDDEGVESIVAFAAIELQGFEEEFRCGWGLEESAPVVSFGC